MGKWKREADRIFHNKEFLFWCSSEDEAVIAESAHNTDIDALTAARDAAREERDEYSERISGLEHELSTQTYMGNSISYIYDKMVNYRNQFSKLCGVPGLLKKDESLLDAVPRVVSERDELKRRLEYGVKVKIDYSCPDDWQDHILTIWVEDDAPVPDKESTNAAFKRITGKDPNQYIERIDNGDHFIYRYLGGWVRLISYGDGAVGVVYKLEDQNYG